MGSKKTYTAGEWLAKRLGVLEERVVMLEKACVGDRSVYAPPSFLGTPTLDEVPVVKGSQEGMMEHNNVWMFVCVVAAVGGVLGFMLARAGLVLL